MDRDTPNASTAPRSPIPFYHGWSKSETLGPPTPSTLLDATPLLRASLLQAPIIELKGYHYFVHPITDGIPRLDPALLTEVASALAQRLADQVDVLLTPEAMGIPIASAVSLRTGKPLTVARKRAYGLAGEIVSEQRTGYGASNLHIHGIGPGDRVAILDDVLSTGGTLRALVRACRAARAHVAQILLVVNKGVDLDAMRRELDAPIDALIRLRVEAGRVVLED
jgi:adenine phosphoribosyltransferase